MLEWLLFTDPPSLLRLQQKLDEVIVRHTDPITDPVAKATKKSSIYEILLHGLIVSAVDP